MCKKHKTKQNTESKEIANKQMSTLGRFPSLFANNTHLKLDTSFTRSCQIHPIRILNIIFWSGFFCPAVQLAQMTAYDVIDALATDVGVT